MRISSACEIFDASAPGSAPSTHPSAWKKHTRKYAVAISGPRHLQMANTAGGLAPRVPRAGCRHERGEKAWQALATLYRRTFQEFGESPPCGGSAPLNRGYGR